MPDLTVGKILNGGEVGLQGARASSGFDAGRSGGDRLAMNKQDDRYGGEGLQLEPGVVDTTETILKRRRLIQCCQSLRFVLSKRVRTEMFDWSFEDMVALNAAHRIEAGRLKLRLLDLALTLRTSMIVLQCIAASFGEIIEALRGRKDD